MTARVLYYLSDTIWHDIPSIISDCSHFLYPSNIHHHSKLVGLQGPPILFVQVVALLGISRIRVTLATKKIWWLLHHTRNAKAVLAVIWAT